MPPASSVRSYRIQRRRQRHHRGHRPEPPTCFRRSREHTEVMMQISNQLLNQLAGMVVLSAIPAVMFALWGEYFKSSIRQLEEEGDEFDRTTEYYRVKVG